MKRSVTRVVFGTLVLGAVIGACSKPPAPTPEITEQPPAAPPVAETPPPVEPAAAPAPAEPAPVVTLNLETIFFDFDSYSLTPAAQSTLRTVSEGLKSNPGTKVQIAGHCDERGSNEYNLALGERRARAVEEFLIAEGVPAADLSIISYGEERPAEQGTGEDVWAKNRRAEFNRL